MAAGQSIWTVNVGESGDVVVLANRLNYCAWRIGEVQRLQTQCRMGELRHPVRLRVNPIVRSFPAVVHAEPIPSWSAGFRARSNVLMGVIGRVSFNGSPCWKSIAGYGRSPGRIELRYVSRRPVDVDSRPLLEPAARSFTDKKAN